MALPDAYDIVRYPNRSYEQTHPQRLAALGVLRGLNPRPPSASRVLEIGCGSGANIAALAAALPGAECVGLDGAETAAASARACAAAIGLANMTFLHARIEDLRAEDLGTFDYVVAHGVYSWIPAEARAALLRLAGSVLAPHGLCYVSYNALPGCHFREMSRRMMRYHVRHLEDPAERIGQGRALLAMLVRGRTGRTEGYDAVLAEEFAHSQEYHESSFFHDDLAAVNDAFYFHEFLAAARDAGLDYAGEAALRDMQFSEFGGEVGALLREMDARDEAVKEQYLDFLRGRRFRQTVLRRADAPAGRIDFSRLTKLWVSAQIERAQAQEDSPHGAVFYAGRKGSGLTVVEPAIQAAIAEVAATWPQAIPVAELATRSGADPDKLAAFLGEAALGGVVDLRVEAEPLARQAGPKPLASAFARWQAQEDRVVTTLVHQRVRLDDEAARRLLLLLDGTRDLDALADALAEHLVGTPEAGRLRQDLPSLLDRFARLGLLSA